jgi:hypothetical protein
MAPSKRASVVSLRYILQPSRFALLKFAPVASLKESFSLGAPPLQQPVPGQCQSVHIAFCGRSRLPHSSRNGRSSWRCCCDRATLPASSWGSTALRATLCDSGAVNASRGRHTLGRARAGKTGAAACHSSWRTEVRTTVL